MAFRLASLLVVASARHIEVSENHGALNKLLQLRQEVHGLQSDPNGSFPEMFYTQKLDHFSTNDITWQQRYFVNWESYKPGGPVLIMIGGEGPISARYLDGSFVNSDLAKKFNGVQVAVEHRFYGKSQPFKTLATENLKYLTSQQALADLSAFTDWFNAVKLSAPAKWFCLGGSYPGSLAAWYRAKYPDHVQGCIASSAPVFAKEDFYEYGEMVWRALAAGGREDVSEKLHAGYGQLTEALSSPTPTAEKEVFAALNVCPFSVESAADRAQLEQSVSTAMSEVVQYNNSLAMHIEHFQDVIAQAKTPLEAALAVTRMVNVTKNPDNATACMDFSVRSLYEQLSNVDPSSASAAGRTWFWQTCNEFGYFQTMRVPSLFGGRTMFTTGASNEALWQGLCEAVFGVPADEVKERVRQTNAYYGGLQPELSRVFFTNGQYDPWSELSIKATPQGLLEKEVHTFVVERGSHCAGLYASRAGDPPMVSELHQKLADLFAAWGAGEGVAEAEVVQV